MKDRTPHPAEETLTKSNATGSALDFQPGTILLERFRVIELLGAGGMGSVYKVQHLHLNKMYALKCLNKSHISDVDWRRFELEAKAANRLDHPNLVKVHDSGLLPEGLPYFVMDLVEGKTVADVIKNKGVLSLAQALKIFVQVGFALSYAHHNGVIHRDIKPSNIMLLGGGEQTMNNAVKVVDFGLAKITGQDGFNQQTLTKTGEIFGSPLYMSPEQCLGTAVDNRSDLYSLGCVMYEILTGAPPLIGDSALSTMMKHQSEKPLSLKEASLGLEYPRQMEAIVAKLLEKDPAERFQDATTLTANLVSLEQQLKESGTLLDEQLTSPSQVKSASIAASPQLNWLGIILGFILGMALGYILARPQTVITEPAVPKLTIPLIPKMEPENEAKNNISKADITNPQPFSEIQTGGRRVFHFPPIEIGEFYGDHRQSVLAKDVVVFDKFQPTWFSSNETLWHNPELMKRFRKDEIRKLEFNGCDENISKLLTYACEIKSIREVWLDDSDITDLEVPLIDRFVNLTGLSIKQTRLTGQALLKLKRLDQLEYINLDNCKALKPLFKHLKNFPHLTTLAVARTNLDAEDIDEIVRAKGLCYIIMNRNQGIDDEQLKKFASMPNLHSIAISDCNVTTKSIATLKKFPALNQIYAPDWSDENMALLAKELPHVRISQSKLSNRREERSYQKEQAQKGKAKYGWSADP